VPRWWGISRDELHAVALYQRTGEETAGNRAAERGTCATRCWASSPIACLRSGWSLSRQALHAGHAHATLPATDAGGHLLPCRRIIAADFPMVTTPSGAAGVELVAPGSKQPRRCRPWERPLAKTLACRIRHWSRVMRAPAAERTTVPGFSWVYSSRFFGRVLGLE